MSLKHATVNLHRNCFSLSLNLNRASKLTLTTKSLARQPKNTTWMMLKTFIIALLKGSIIKTNQLRKTKNTSKSTRIWLLLLNRIHRPARKWAALVRLIAINSQLNVTSKIKTHTPKTQVLWTFRFISNNLSHLIGPNLETLRILPALDSLGQQTCTLSLSCSPMTKFWRRMQRCSLKTVPILIQKVSLLIRFKRQNRGKFEMNTRNSRSAKAMSQTGARVKRYCTFTAMMSRLLPKNVQMIAKSTAHSIQTTIWWFQPWISFITRSLMTSFSSTETISRHKKLNLLSTKLNQTTKLRVLSKTKNKTCNLWTSRRFATPLVQKTLSTQLNLQFNLI